MSEPLVTERELRGLLRRLDALEKRVQRVEVIERTAYAFGTYSPTYVGGTTAGVTTYTLQAGAWTRIGNVLIVRGQVVWSAATGTGTARISLPFAAGAGNYAGACVLINVTFAAGSPEVLISAGDLFLTLLSPATNAAGTAVAVEAAGNITFTVVVFT